MAGRLKRRQILNLTNRKPSTKKNLQSDMVNGTIKLSVLMAVNVETY